MLNEINMRDTDIILKQIKENDLDVGGECVIAIGDFFQLPPVITPDVFKLPKGANVYYCLVGNKWHTFTVHEPKEIVRQSSDPEFADLLNALGEGNETEDDIEQVRELEDNDTTN